jgi:hypothetical protein
MRLMNALINLAVCVLSAFIGIFLSYPATTVQWCIPVTMENKKHVAIRDGQYYPENDIYQTLDDGRTILLASAGVPIPMHLAEVQGFIKDGVPVGPTEIKTVAKDTPIAGIGSTVKAQRKNL